MNTVVKVCRNTGITLTERTFANSDDAMKFAHIVGAHGYKKSDKPNVIYESERFYIQVV